LPKRLEGDVDAVIVDQQPTEAGRYEPTWLCQACSADFRNWMQIPGEDRRDFLRRHMGWEITLLLEGCCPACGERFV